jgi:hypothetical protein
MPNAPRNSSGTHTYRFKKSQGVKEYFSTKPRLYMLIRVLFYPIKPNGHLNRQLQGD